MLSRLAVNNLVNSSFHPCQVKSVHADGKGQECRHHGRKAAGAKHSRHLLWKPSVHHGTVVNTSVLANSLENIFQKGGTDFAATHLGSHHHAWKRASFNLMKESSCFCGLSIFDLSAQIDNEVVKLVLVKMTISWWAQTTYLRPTEVLQLHPNHWTDIKRCELTDIIF